MILLISKLLVVAFLYSLMSFLVLYYRKRLDTADVAWGISFIVFCFLALLISQNFTWHALALLSLVAIWGFRLSCHIYSRQNSKPEDPRYLSLTQKWGKWFYFRSYLQINLLQAFLSFVVALPAISFISTPLSPNIPIFISGVMVWLIGFSLEAVGDYQLRQFTRNPKNQGRLLTTGLWAYSRHPNYFGEVLLWWGIWLISLSNSFNPFLLIGPLLITYLIIFVSGIPLLEKRMSGHSDFPAYAKKVSKFFPLPPKNT